jgi:hypothetical protein
MAYGGTSPTNSVSSIVVVFSSRIVEVIERGSIGSLVLIWIYDRLTR